MYIHSFITIKLKSLVNVFKPIYTINNIMIFSFLISYILSRNEELNNFLIIIHINKTSLNVKILTYCINVATINAFFEYKLSAFFRDYSLFDAKKCKKHKKGA